MKKIAFCLDYDGCVANTNYVFPFTPENVGDIRTNTSMVDTNPALWTHILTICQANSDLEELEIMPFSLRQSPVVDAQNSHVHEIESYFLALQKIEIHLAKLLADNGITATVTLNRLLLPDALNNKTPGDTFQTALDIIDLSLEGRGMIPARKILDLPNIYNIDDETKITLLYMHVQASTAQGFYFVDDRMDILKLQTAYFGSDIGKALIPANVDVTLCRYDDGTLTHPTLATITGTGIRCRDYAKVVCLALKSLFTQNSVLTSSASDSTSTNEKSERFLKLHIAHLPTPAALPSLTQTPGTTWHRPDSQQGSDGSHPVKVRRLKRL